MYDGATTASVTLSDDRIAGDVLSLAYTGAAFDTKAVGSGKAVNVTGISVTGTDAGNYTFNTDAATTADITAKGLTVDGLTAANKVYDGTTTATLNTAGAALVGVVAGDTVDLDTAAAAGTFADKNVGVAKAVTISTLNLTGADAGNYILTPPSLTANITAKALTVTATANDKIYDGTTAASVLLADNRISGDMLTKAYTAANFNNKNVGTGKAVDVTGITVTGTDAGNYTFNTTAAATANITPKVLMVTAHGIDKVYDGTTAATVTLSDNRIAGDVLVLAYTAATFATADIGTNIVVTVTGISVTGADRANYFFAPFNTTAVTIANITGSTRYIFLPVVQNP